MLLATGDLSGDVTVTGNLGRVVVRGDVLGSTIDVGHSVFDPGGWGLLSVLGDVNNASIEVEDLFGKVNVGGDFSNSTIQAGALRRVVVGGRITGDPGDGADQIHADRGRFFARDETWGGWIDAGHDHWFDDVRVWVDGL